MIKKIIITLLLGSLIAFFGGFTTPSHALPIMQQFSPEQLEQFKQLPRAEQERLARQFGFDLNVLNQMGAGTSELSQGQEQVQLMYPRGTRFDADGIPILPEELELQFGKKESGELPIFGQLLFAAQPSTFSPSGNIPTPENYMLGVGDVLNVQLFGRETRSHKLEIDSSGAVNIPELGPIHLLGMNYNQAQALIQEQIKTRLIGFEAAISLASLRSIQVFIVGEAAQPGAYNLSSLSTITQALYAAGGVSEVGSLRNIQLKRAGGLVTDFDLYDLLLRGDSSGDKVLQSGDVIVIQPRQGLVAVAGEVNRPARFELKGNETFADLFRFAGGFTPTALKVATRIERIETSQRVTRTLDFTTEKALQLKVQSGDIITVGKVSDEIVNSVLFLGAVQFPGGYEWWQGMQLGDLIHSTSRTLMPTADRQYGLIVREDSESRRVRVIQFSPLEVAQQRSNKASDAAIALEAGDQVLIFSRFEMRDEERLYLKRELATRDSLWEQERVALVESYRRKFLRDLIEKDDRKQAGTLGVSTLFGSEAESEIEQEHALEDYSDFSRFRMLEPLLKRLEMEAEPGLTPFYFVSGEVRRPGLYPLAENTNVNRALASAAGLKDSAYIERVELTRAVASEQGVNRVYESIDLADSQAMSITFQGRERLIILPTPEWNDTNEVTIAGEVRFPGTYPVRQGEGIKHLIERAGGLTERAHTAGAILTREEVRHREQETIRQLAGQLQTEITSNIITGSGNVSRPYSEMQQLLRDLMSLRPQGRMIIDLPHVIAGRQADITLKDKDTLLIPSLSDTVSVIGEVQLATTYRFNKKLNVNDYIQRSGGFSEKAASDRVYVVRANGSIERYNDRRGWFSAANTLELQPGDTIVVPLETTYMSNLDLWSRVTTIIYNSAVALAAINSI